MLEFKTIGAIKPNREVLEVIKNYAYKVKKGAAKHIILLIYKLSSLRDI